MWGSVVVAVALVTMVLVLFVTLNHAIGARRTFESDLTRLELTHEGIQAAIRHFRHDVGNFLGALSMANEVVQATLRRQGELPAELERPLALLEASLRQTLKVIHGFEPGKPEAPAPLDLAKLTAQLSESLVVGGGHLENQLPSWVIQTPPVAMTILLGNLLKNALDAAEHVIVRREGEALLVENPISEADAAFLETEDVYRHGVSSHGSGRGIGLHSAHQAAAQCRARLSHRLLHPPDRTWVQFRIDLGAPEADLVATAPARAAAAGAEPEAEPAPALTPGNPMDR